jgi:hypothetical protein
MAHLAFHDAELYLASKQCPSKGHSSGVYKQVSVKIGRMHMRLMETRLKEPAITHNLHKRLQQ